ncbi:MAG: HlyD family efflux transporter periplasmic adaptor subunit, partial [Proteobacteria bacterium]|nr:HlyD family efflux transporter periplasmic adaptor subunit [Pseudomonadota bacterium]
RWLAGRPAALLRSARQALADPRRPSLRLGLAAAVLALAGLLWWPSDWRVTADAVVEGAQQRAIAAPFEGYIGSALHRAGETVAAGTVIATLDERTLRLEHARWSAESAQHDKRLRDALSRHDRPAAGLARAGLDQAEAQLALVGQRLERARLVSPFPAVIVSGDLSQQIGSPVEQGKVLFELAPLDAWRVILKVDERDIRAVAPGQRGRLVPSGLSGETIPFHVLNIAMPEAGEGRNRFRVEAALDGDSPRLRPGMEGVGKIEVGERSLAWIWTHKAIDWLRLELWRLWP